VFILASESPRRLALLAQAGIVPDTILPADIDETARKAEQPRAYVLRLAIEKARAVAARKPGAFVLAADTAVALGRRILPKAEDDAMVADCLKKLSGRRHQVLTAVALVSPSDSKDGGKLRTRVAMTRVSVLRLTDEQIARYVQSREGVGKAGGYAIQGRAEALIKEISGSYSNVVGLPLAMTVALLQGAGLVR
jgi:septum formation protein